MPRATATGRSMPPTTGQWWIVHHDDLLKAVVLLGEMLGVDWEDG